MSSLAYVSVLSRLELSYAVSGKAQNVPEGGGGKAAPATFEGLP